MSKLPQKLIVVGMRFQSDEDIQVLDKYRGLRKLEDMPFVLLAKERNTEGYNGYAYRVLVDGKHVGYVRNGDMPQLTNCTAIVDGAYQLTRVCANYLVLELSTLAKAKPGDYVYLSTPSSKDTELGWKDFHEYSARDTLNSLDSWANRPPSVASFAKEYEAKFISDSEPTNKEQKMSFNTSSMRDSFFREIKNVAIDMQSGKMGVLTNDGISVYTKEGVSVNPMTELSFKLPAFAMRISIDDLAEGDIIINGTEASFFKGATETGYEIVTMSGEVKQVGQVSNLFFGKNSVLAVKNMFGNMGNGASGMNPMMMAMLMSDDKDSKLDPKMLMMAMMMSGSESAGGMNPMMMAILMSK